MQATINFCLMCLPFLSTTLLLHVSDALGTCLRGMCCTKRLIVASAGKIKRAWMRNRSFMTRNNQQSSHSLTIFEQHVTSARPHCFSDLFVRDMHVRGKNGGLQAIILAESLALRYLPSV